MIIKEIQGLRSISILLIILFHLEITNFEFGFIGVDIFLVISGFIFSKIIIGDYHNGNFKFSKYYNRRVKRLLPALLVTLFFVTIFSWLFLIPLELKYYGQSLFSSASFLSNFYYYIANNDYFLPNSYSLIHLWSLSLEIQFYIIYPILIFFIFRYKFLKNKISNIIFLLAMISFIANIFFSENEKLIFNLIPFRIWEFFFGYFVYDLIFNKKNIFFSKKNYKLIFFIVILLIYLIFGNSSLIRHEAIAVLSFFVIFKISFNNNNFLNKFLNNSFNQYIAKYSYSIFLVHFPVIYFGKYFEIYNENLVGLILIIVLIIFFTYFVFNIEKKFYMIGQNKSISYINLYLINFSLFLFLLLGLFFNYSKGVKFRYFLNDKLNSNYIVKAYNESSSKKIDGMDCNIYCKKIIGFDKSLLLFGNSHAGDFEKVLEVILNRKKINLYISYVMGREEKEEKLQLYKLSKAIQTEKVDYIYIIHHNYSLSKDKYINELISIIKQYPHIEFYYFLPRFEFYDSPIKLKILEKDDLSIKFNQNNFINKKLNEAVSEVRKLNYDNFNIIDQNKILTKLSSPTCDKIECFDGHDNIGMPLYRDNHHLTFYGANLLIKEINHLKNY